MNLPGWVVVGICTFNIIGTLTCVFLADRWRRKVKIQSLRVERQAQLIEWCKFKIHKCYRGEYDHMFRRLEDGQTKEKPRAS